MENDLQAIVAQAEASQASISSRSDWDQAKAAILGPKGSLTQASKLIGQLPREEKPAFGQALNQAKKQIESLFAGSLSKIEQQADLAALGEPYDPTLPAVPNRTGSLHPLSATRRKVVSIFRKLGFTVTEATEVETEWFCFDALNTPEDHPARDAQDTLFFSPESKWANVSKKAKEAHLLRTHTSSVQIRTMLREKPPLRVIAPPLFPSRYGGRHPFGKFSPDRGSVYRPKGHPARFEGRARSFPPGNFWQQGTDAPAPQFLPFYRTQF